MDLWIRSQDKSVLVKVEELRLSRGETCIGNNKYGTLGEYKTKERALEILDEIQTLLIGKKIINLNNGVQRIESLKLDNIVYEMPGE